MASAEQAGEGAAFSLLSVCAVPARHCGDPALTAHPPPPHRPCMSTKLSPELRAVPSAGPGKETEVQGAGDQLLSSKTLGAVPAQCVLDRER